MTRHGARFQCVWHDSISRNSIYNGLSCACSAVEYFHNINYTQNVQHVYRVVYLPPGVHNSCIRSFLETVCVCVPQHHILLPEFFFIRILRYESVSSEMPEYAVCGSEAIQRESVDEL